MFMLNGDDADADAVRRKLFCCLLVLLEGRD